jgi:hypothetical protein
VASERDRSRNRENAPAPAGLGAPARHPCALGVCLRKEVGGPVLAREPVKRADLTDCLSELWFDAHLRRGFPDVTFGDLRAELHPLYNKDGLTERSCAGFRLRTRNAAGEEIYRVFPRTSLEPVAMRGLGRMIEDGILEQGDVFYYDVEYPLEHAVVGDALAGLEDRPAPEVRRTPLAPLLERAEAVSVDLEKDAFPVLYTRSALERAEAVSRKGGDANPPEETGGLLIGWLGSCPESGETFAVITEVLEAAHAEGTTYRLTYSGQTWARIQAIMDAKRRRPEMRGVRILGQSHGHSFVPFDGDPGCEACPHLEVCTRSSAFLSLEDRSWCRAVFHGEPWQLSHIWGLNARTERVQAFFGQKRGALAPRGYHVIDDDVVSKCFAEE